MIHTLHKASIFINKDVYAEKISELAFYNVHEKATINAINTSQEYVKDVVCETATFFVMEEANQFIKEMANYFGEENVIV
mgnify:FL=1